MMQCLAVDRLKTTIGPLGHHQLQEFAWFMPALVQGHRHKCHPHHANCATAVCNPVARLPVTAGDAVKLHPNRDAPRCLPCGYQDPLLIQGSCPARRGFIAPEVGPSYTTTLYIQRVPLCS